MNTQQPLYFFNFLILFLLRENLCYLDAGSVTALQLLSEEQHPAASKAGKVAASKEGLSLLSLLARTASNMALPLLRFDFQLTIIIVEKCAKIIV